MKTFLFALVLVLCSFGFGFAQTSTIKTDGSNIKKIQFTDNSTGEDQKLADGWIFRKIFKSDKTLESQFFIRDNKTVFYNLSLNSEGKLASILIDPHHSTSVGLWIHLGTSVFVIEPSVTNKPADASLYDDLLKVIDALPVEIQKTLIDNKEAVHKAAEKPTTLTLVKD